MIFIYHDIFEHYATNIKHIPFHCLSLVFVRFDSFGSVRFGFISYFDVVSWCRIIFNFWYGLFLFVSVSFMRSWVYFFYICISVLCVRLPLSLYLALFLFPSQPLLWTILFLKWCVHLIFPIICTSFSIQWHQIYRINHWHFFENNVTNSIFAITLHLFAVSMVTIFRCFCCCYIYIYFFIFQFSHSWGVFVALFLLLS